MKAHLKSSWPGVLLLGSSLASITACKNNDPEDVSSAYGTESHFLEACERDGQCGPELECLGGRCSVECNSDEDCVALDAFCAGPIGNVPQSCDKQCTTSECSTDPSELDASVTLGSRSDATTDTSSASSSPHNSDASLETTESAALITTTATTLTIDAATSDMATSGETTSDTATSEESASDTGSTDAALFACPTTPPAHGFPCQAPPTSQSPALTCMYGCGGAEDCSEDGSCASRADCVESDSGWTWQLNNIYTCSATNRCPAPPDSTELFALVHNEVGTEIGGAFQCFGGASPEPALLRDQAELEAFLAQCSFGPAGFPEVDYSASVLYAAVVGSRPDIAFAYAVQANGSVNVGIAAPAYCGGAAPGAGILLIELKRAEIGEDPTVTQTTCNEGMCEGPPPP